MKKSKRLESLEKGQILPLVVLGLVALIGMAALILDGSLLMSHRREAQSAADAAALAGAEYLCPPNYDISLAIAEATNYVGLNNAVLAEAISFPDESTIHVEASVQSDSFFSRIFNQTQLSATADAEAKCSPLDTGHGNLPVAFPCLTDEEDEDDDCLVSFYDEEETFQWNMEHGRLTILMESGASQIECYDPVTNPLGVICDIDGDGINDIVSMAATGWLSFDNNCNTSVLIDWIEQTVDPPDITTGYWLSNCTAVTTSVYHAIKPLVPLAFRVPIYNKQCPKTPPSVECPLLWEPGDNDSLVLTGSGHLAYRIVAFGLFNVTCVQDKNFKEQDGPEGNCPFRYYLETNETPNLPDLDDNLKSIEGYFIEGTFPSGGGGTFDYGYYVVHLNK